MSFEAIFVKDLMTKTFGIERDTQWREVFY